MKKKKEMIKNLESKVDFKEFFIEVSKYRVDMIGEELKILIDIIDSFSEKFGYEAIIYLKDSILTEKLLPCKSSNEREYHEKEFVEELKKDFKVIFPDYEIIKNEYFVFGIGRIDILAKEKSTNRDIIIEIKAKNNNPNKQLISYSSEFENPILIGITEQELNRNQKLEGIIYYTYEEIRSRKNLVK
jgi:hypothetical protein